jgi:myo-inositol-1(or 4)-monophosphatase
LPGTDLILLREAAKEAGGIATRYFNATPKVWDKPGDAGPVTEADLAVDGMLRRTLSGARPSYGWLSEESEDTPDRLRADRVFIVDPIDGTRAFIEGARDWAHSIAIAEGGRITAAVVYLPLRKLMFAARLGRGATVNGRPIHVTPARDLTGASLLSSRPGLAPENWKEGAVPAMNRSFRSSLAYRLCLVAQGQYDAMITLRPTWEWDIAAGSLIVTEAQGSATDRRGNPLIFNNAHPQIDGVVAAGGLHASLLDRLVRH